MIVAGMEDGSRASTWVGKWLRNPRIWIVVVFVLSRLAYYAAGVRFDAAPLWDYWQLVDPDLLRQRLWESLVYLHMQPPGFNLLAGLVLKLFPDQPAPALHAIQMVQGLVAGLCLFELMRLMGVRDRFSAPLTMLFIVSPGVVLFENLFIYDYLSMAQLLLCGVLLYRFVDAPTKGRALAFQLSMLAMMLVRNGFHLPYFILLTAVMWWFMKAERGMIARAALVPLIVVTGLHLKNWALFGQFTASTWHGVQAAFVTTLQLNEDEKARLHQAGVVSSAALFTPDVPLERFAGHFSAPAATGIPVLDRPRGLAGRPNFNHSAYLQLQGVFLDDAKAVLLHYPKAYVRSVLRAWFCYFLPVGDYPQLGENRRRIAQWDRLFNLVVFGQWKEAQPRRNLRAVEAEHGALAILPFASAYLLAGLPLLFGWGLWRLWTGSRRQTLSRADIATLAFMLYNLASLTVLFNFLACFDNNRYRLCLDGFFVVLAGMALTAATAGRAQSKPEAAKAQVAAL